MPSPTRVFMPTILVIGLGASFQCGFLDFMYNVPQDVLEQFLNQSIQSEYLVRVTPASLSAIWASIAGAPLLGKFVACFFESFFVEEIDHKWTILYCGVFAVFGALIQFMARPMEMFLLILTGRFVCGATGEIANVVAPLFFKQMANSADLGNKIHNGFYLLGNVFSFIIGLPEVLGTNDRWNYTPIIPMFLTFFSMFWLVFVQENSSHDSNFEQSSFQRKKIGNQKLGHAERRKQLLTWFTLHFGAVFFGMSILNNYSTYLIAGTSSFSLFHKCSSLVIKLLQILIVTASVGILRNSGSLLILMWISTVCVSVLSVAFFYGNLQSSSATWIRIIFVLLWSIFQNLSYSKINIYLTGCVVPQKMKTISKAASFLAEFIIILVFLPFYQYDGGSAYAIMIIPCIIVLILIGLHFPTSTSLVPDNEARPLLNSRPRQYYSIESLRVLR